MLRPGRGVCWALLSIPCLWAALVPTHSWQGGLAWLSLPGKGTSLMSLTATTLREFRSFWAWLAGLGHLPQDCRRRLSWHQASLCGPWAGGAGLGPLHILLTVALGWHFPGSYSGCVPIPVRSQPRAEALWVRVWAHWNEAPGSMIRVC